MFLHSISHGSSGPFFIAMDKMKEAKENIILSTYYLEAQGKSGQCLIETLKRCQAKHIFILTNHHVLDQSITYSFLSTLA